MPDSEIDQAKLVLELQKENSEQLVCHQQKMLTIQAQSLAASPAQQRPPSRLPPCSTQRKVERSILSNNCFSTPECAKKKANDTDIQELRNTVKDLKSEMEKLKKEHALQLKQKDDFIRDLIIKYGLEGQREKIVVTRSSLRRGENPATVPGELKSPRHRFVSPFPASKKRSFWDVTNNSSRSAVALNGRKTRSHVGLKPIQLRQCCFRHTFLSDQRKPLTYKENYGCSI